MKASLRERLYSRLVPAPETGCLLWTGAQNGHGYGRIFAGGCLRLVHCVAWELDNGPVPDGLELDHVKARGCCHRHCANVAHLELVTHRVNVLRGSSPNAIAAAATHCPQEHEYNDANTYIYPSGTRRCRECRRDQMRRYRAAERRVRDDYLQLPRLLGRSDR